MISPVGSNPLGICQIKSVLSFAISESTSNTKENSLVVGSWIFENSFNLIGFEYAKTGVVMDIRIKLAKNILVIGLILMNFYAYLINVFK